MEWEIIGTVVIPIIEYAVKVAIEKAVEYVVRKGIDEAGRAITRIGYYLDTDGDGIEEFIELGCWDTLMPDFDDTFSICNDGDKIGLGMPQYQLIDGMSITDYADTLDTSNLPTITGNSQGWLMDVDFDGEKEVVVELPDLTGDGFPDFGWPVDTNDDSLPDASPDGPFIEFGSEEYDKYVQQTKEAGNIIVVSGDGSMSVYDMNGNITAEDCDTAYSLWVSKNGIMNKPIDNYTVTEGLLFIGFIVASFGFLHKIFRRKRVM